MRRMADSIVAGNCPVGFDLYAGYDDGRYMDADAIKALHPDKPVVKVTVFPTDDEGDCLDVENGDATPAQAPAWVSARRAAGHPSPSVYCSEAVWPQVQSAFANAGVKAPNYWIAGYPGSVGEALYPGAVAHQWIDRGPYDESIVADYWPGVDPVPPVPHPLPTPTTEEEDDVADIVVKESADGNRHVFVSELSGTATEVHHWWQSMSGKPSWAWNYEKLGPQS